MSIRQILKAREIVCVVPDARKATAVQACLEGEINPKAPASILRTHPNTTIYLDRSSAGLPSAENPSPLAASSPKPAPPPPLPPPNPRTAPPHAPHRNPS